jgi:hypothetical protein
MEQDKLDALKIELVACTSQALVIYFGDNLRVVYLKETKNSGNGDIQKCRIKVDSAISIHLEFIAKI